eukprot:CAMPEP_0118910066 /NCGR_PEP_ID=MMETSP1166-20130328/12370_1 /TAXON_ID=1104430 /ORGANISM="Chrysoreinhardia sp, Strain CCMP3193" /LENGTH=350 /DNA_ID=CAMNT_0006849521 /DNA_START=18 /DNA_END=1070 /DNA_ORIENTATION=+
MSSPVSNRRVPSVKMRSLEDHEACFEIRETDCSVANALRRVMISEIVTMAIDLVTFSENTSVVNDEIIAHRLGLVPIKYKYRPGGTKLLSSMGGYVAFAEGDVRRRFRFTRDCDCDSHCQFCSVEFSLDMENTGEDEDALVVTTNDLLSSDPDVSPVHFTTEEEQDKSDETGIALVKLARGQRVAFTAVAKLGIGKEHAKWSPVSKCVFRPEPSVSFDDVVVASLTQPIRDAIVKIAPSGVLAFADALKPDDPRLESIPLADRRKRIVVKNEAAILDYVDEIQLFTKSLSPTGKPLIHATPSDTNFIFDVESVGAIPVHEIVLSAISTIQEKFATLKDEVDRLEREAAEE